MFKNLVFLNPILGITSFLIGLFLVFLVFKTKNFKLNFKFLDDLEKVFGKSNYYFKGVLVFLLILVTLFSIIIGNPNLKGVSKKETKNGIDIVLVLDLSYSMLAKDIKPTRLDMAKEIITDFVNQLKTDRIGLIVFSGKPFTSIPLTFDYDFVSDYVKNININTINQNYSLLQGTAIGDGLLYGANLFKDDENRQKVIVLLTDGEANKGIEPIQAVRFIKEKNIKIHTVGIGGYKDTYVEINDAFGKQKIAISGVDEDTLKSIANITSGEYYRASDNDTFQNLFKNLNLLDKNEIEINSIVVYDPIYKPFVYLLVMIFLLFISFNTYYYLKN